VELQRIVILDKLEALPRSRDSHQEVTAGAGGVLGVEPMPMQKKERKNRQNNSLDAGFGLLLIL